ncbi:hypothetical protein [Aquimarina muelleri]|uniref:Adhesin domain-containing protein n=1 Tax=Aquimarina muelleri TaxID=279356 RepID=A0A918N217_9FLAO|nr:hypothetical protein [Aquimarina muelleri]MCX2761186.1 hypothetical protein [Aquimarina muelleri]GGX08903.1 hypothetical protein GCM10007384_08380 [Aquimarina muelleri]
MKYKLNIFTLSVLCCTGVFAQEKQSKLNKKLVVNNDVTINLNTSHTNIVFETWNKNTVSVDAYLEGDLSDENNKRVLDSWQVNVVGDNKEVTINSVAGNLWSTDISSSNINTDRNLQELKMLGPAITNMLGPLMENIAKNPMPNALSESKANVNYDNSPFKEKNEKYIKQWESQIREKFKEDIGEKKQKWAKEFENKGIKIPEGKKDIRLETWGEQYGKQMDAWASQLIKDIQSQQSGLTNVTVYRYSSSRVNNNSTSAKTIKIHIPVKAKLRLNIRHGDVQLAEKSNNVKASLSHTKLSANVIDGDQTFIKASYSPVFVRQWNNGRLVINYVKNCRIQKAKSLTVNADSSNIFIQQLDKKGAISASFGVITIANLGESFSTLDLVVQNSDFKLNLPKIAFNLSYNGAQSIIALPKTMEISTRKNFGNVLVNGFQNSRSTDKMITINAKYSEVVLNNK